MKKLLTIVLLLPFIAACGTKVQRLDTETRKDISGKWNDTDSRMVAETMIQEALSGPWYAKALKATNGNEPVVIVGTVDNQSM